MENHTEYIDQEVLASIIPPSMMHREDDQVSSTELSDGTKVISDSISDTIITRREDGKGICIAHFDHFGCRSKEDLERLNHECFVNMLKNLDDDELEEVRKINNADSISDLYVFKPSNSK